MNETLKDLLVREQDRQDNYAHLIASENFASEAVRELSGSIFTNKYAEGYPGARYYNGCEIYDEVELLAQQKLQEAFSDTFHCNVQPHSGANANLAVMSAFLKPGDKILSMSLAEGGHLSHGTAVNISGKLYEVINYGVNDFGAIDYGKVEDLAREHKPKLIVAGASAYAMKIRWDIFRQIADRHGGYLLCDMAHYSGLIAGGVYPSPIPHADFVTSTTHKTLRGPRSGIIIWKNYGYTKKINSAIFPGTQGGPLMQQIAAKAQAFHEAAQPEFKRYAEDVVYSAKSMADVFKKEGIKMVGGGTESHMLLLNVDPVRGSDLANRLEQEHKIVVNKNGVPNDKLPPKYTSGIRIGTAAETTRGKDYTWFREVAHTIVDVIKDMS